MRCSLPLFFVQHYLCHNRVHDFVAFRFRYYSFDHGANWTLDTVNGSDPLQFEITGTTGGVTPEPSSLFLLGTGLLGCASFLRRKLLA